MDVKPLRTETASIIPVNRLALMVDAILSEKCTDAFIIQQENVTEAWIKKQDRTFLKLEGWEFVDLEKARLEILRHNTSGTRHFSCELNGTEDNKARFFCYHETADGNSNIPTENSYLNMRTVLSAAPSI